jgi:hypothetical protein
MKLYTMTVEVLVELPDHVDPDCLAVDELVYGSFQSGVGPDDISILEWETVGFKAADAPEAA